jgi:hypothetical protein
LLFSVLNSEGDTLAGEIMNQYQAKFKYEIFKSVSAINYIIPYQSSDPQHSDGNI